MLYYQSPGKAVTNIMRVPSGGIKNEPLTLTGTVVPAYATKNTIVWTVNDAGTTGASINMCRILLSEYPILMNSGV